MCIFLSRHSYVVTVTFNSFMKIYRFQIFVGQSTPVQVENTIMDLKLQMGLRDNLNLLQQRLLVIGVTLWT